MKNMRVGLRIAIAWIVLALISTSPAVQAQTSSAPSLDARVRAEIAPFKGKVSLFAKNLDTDQTYSFNGDERVRTASTIKVAVMIEAFTRVAEGRAKWTDELVLTKAGSVAGTCRWTAAHVARLRKSDDGR
jgi:beta-lactamase class A